MNISENDTVFIRFNKILKNNFEEPWTQTLIMGKDGYFNEGQMQIDLVQGAYEVTAQLMDYNGVIIPKECQEICLKSGRLDWSDLLFLYLEKECQEVKLIPENNISIDVAMWGGVEFNNTNPFIVSNSDLFTDNSLEFYVARFPDPRCIDDMNEPATVGKLTKRYRAELTPVFKLNNETLVNETLTN
jgi:hypothetical protein